MGGRARGPDAAEAANRTAKGDGRAAGTGGPDLNKKGPGPRKPRPFTSIRKEGMETLTESIGFTAAEQKGLTEPALTPAEARALTDEVKADLLALHEKCLRLYEGRAHEALGYSSWAAYAEAEFGEAKSNAYRALDFARVLRMLPDSPIGERLNEAQARELVPLLDDERALVAAYQQAKAIAEERGAKLTANHLRSAVQQAVRKAVGQLALLNDDLEAAAALGVRRRKRRGEGDWKPGPISTVSREDMPGALAASQRNVDDANQRLGEKRWGESLSMTGWRHQLAEAEAGPARSAAVGGRRDGAAGANSAAGSPKNAALGAAPAAQAHMLDESTKWSGTAQTARTRSQGG